MRRCCTARAAADRRHDHNAHAVHERAARYRPLITSAQQHLDAADAGSYAWRSFDAEADKGLFVCYGLLLRSVAVVGHDGLLTTLGCARELHCSRNDGVSLAAALSPGADEVTVESGGRTVQILAYDGSLRRTLSLDAVLPPSHEIVRLAWSPDGSRVAIVTGPGNDLTRDIWLLDSRGAGRLAYSGKVWALGGWASDGHSLLVDVYVGQLGADVVRLDLQPEGAGNTVTPRTLYRSWRHFDWAGNLAWSPDGTRVAVRTMGSIVEISAQDGTEFVRHPHIDGWLIWPRHKR